MRSKEQQTFIKRLNELLPRGEATVIAQRTGIHLSTISNWRQGKPPINPSLEMLTKLAHAFNVPAAYLITDVSLLVASPFERDELEAILRSHVELSDRLLSRLAALKKKQQGE
jgi:transcriptional regulator with XRE-family HTH domain